MVASLNKSNSLGRKNPCHHRTRNCPTNHTKNRKVRDLLDTWFQGWNAYNSDLEFEAIRGKNSVNRCRQIRMVQYIGKRIIYRGLPFWKCYEENRPITYSIVSASQKSFPPPPKVRHLDKGLHSLGDLRNVPAW